MRQEFTIPGRLDGLNEYTNACRSHWSKGRAMKRENQDVVLWAIKAARLAPMGRVNIHYTWYEKPDKKNGSVRDKDNISNFGRKVINDALQEAGIIPNDDWAYIGNLSEDFFLASGEPRIVVTLEEA